MHRRRGNFRDTFGGDQYLGSSDFYVSLLPPEKEGFFLFQNIVL